MNPDQILNAQIADQIIGRQWFLIRAQQPQATDFNAPQIPADWMLVQLSDGILYSSTGRRLSKRLSESDLSTLADLRLTDPDRWNEEDFWAQYAREFDLHETHTNTDPIILCLPAQPHLNYGGKSTAQQFANFLQQFA